MAERETFSKVMTADQKLAAYSAGVNDAKLSLEQQKNNVQYITSYGKESGVVGNDIAKSYDKGLIKAADRIAKALGVKIEFVNTLENGTVNGSIKNGYIQIAKDAYHENMTAENIAAVVVGHEITHRMQELAPIEYAKYRNYVVENNPKLVNDVANAYRAAGYAITYGSADGGARFSRKIDGNSKIGYNNKNNVRYSPRGIKLSAEEKAKFESSVSTAYNEPQKTHKGLQYQSCVFDGKHILYIYEDGGFGNYNVVARIDFASEDIAITVMEEIGNGTTFRITDLIDEIIEIIRNRQSSYTVYNAHTKKRISSRSNGVVHKGQSESYTGGTDADSSGTSGNQRGNRGVKYSIKETSGAESRRTISWEEIVDEAAAEYTGYILKSPETLNQFINDFKNGRLGETAEQNSGVFKQLWQAIKDFISNVKKAFKGDKKAQDKAAKDTFGMPMSELEKARDLLGAAFAESERVVREKNAPSQFARQTAPPKGSHAERSFDSAQDDKKGEGKKYSIKFNGKTEVVFERSFAEQVDEVLNSGKIERNHIFVGNTPSILKQIGLPDLPMLITSGHIKDMNHDEVKGITKYHGMSKELIKGIPHMIDNPAIIFDSISAGNTNAICILSNKVDDKGRPIQIVIKPNGKGKYNNIEIQSNFLLSAYGKDNVQLYLNELEKKVENVIYINKKRTQEMLKTAGLYLPAGLNKLRSDVIIHKTQQNVNSNESKKSIKMDDVLKQNATLKKAYTQLRAEYAKLQSGKKVADTKRIAKVVKNLLNENGFSYNSKRLTEQFEGLTADAQAIFEGKMDFEAFSGKVREVAKAVIDEGTKTDSIAYQESKKVRDYLRTTAISLSAEDKANLGDEYETIRKGTFGRLRLVKEGGTPIDVAYQEMSELL